VDVDESRRDRHASGVDLDGSLIGETLADRRDVIAGDGDIRLDRRRACSIDYVAASYDEIVRRAAWENDGWRGDQACDGARGAGQKITSGGQNRLSVRGSRTLSRENAGRERHAKSGSSADVAATAERGRPHVGWKHSRPEG
jgi:hypothetical protein